MQGTLTPTLSTDMATWGQAINEAIRRFSDKDWNYSRIFLVLKQLSELDSPYVLGIDWLDVRSKKGQADYKTMLGEITWGGRHSNELGVLELISLRLNRALSEVTSSEYWHSIRPIVRLRKREELLQSGHT